MIDAVLNIAVFAALVLCIVGFGAWNAPNVVWQPCAKKGSSTSMSLEGILQDPEIVCPTPNAVKAVGGCLASRRL